MTYRPVTRHANGTWHHAAGMVRDHLITEHPVDPESLGDWAGGPLVCERLPFKCGRHEGVSFFYYEVQP